MLQNESSDPVPLFQRSDGRICLWEAVEKLQSTPVWAGREPAPRRGINSIGENVAQVPDLRESFSAAS
jgi:hypothetical protein